MTVGADKAYHERDFVEALRCKNLEPHIGAYRRNRVDMVGPAVRLTPAYQDSQRKRKWIERCFSWLKEPGRQCRDPFQGTAARRLELHLCGRSLRSAAHGKTRSWNVTQSAGKRQHEAPRQFRMFPLGR